MHLYSHKTTTAPLALALALALAAQPSFALDKIYSPNGHKGELEFEYSASTTQDSDNSKDNVQSHEFEMEYGVTDRLTLELEGAFDKEPGARLTSSKAEIGGRYQFFEQGENWIDTGLLLAYGHATHRSGDDELEAKLLLEKQSGKFLHRANIGLEQALTGNGDVNPERSFLWSSRYRYNAHFEPGFEIQSEFGKDSEDKRFKQQEHYVGPAVYGQIMPQVKYEAAYLFGVSDAASNGAARLLLEYEIAF